MNRAQELQLLRVALGGFNAFDGETIAQDLRENEALWESLVFGRFENLPLLELRDLREGFVNADTIFLLTHKNKLADLLKLVKRWNADEVGWQTSDDHGGNFVCDSAREMLGDDLGPEDVLVRIWWD